MLFVGRGQAQRHFSFFLAQAKVRPYVKAQHEMLMFSWEAFMAPSKNANCPNTSKTYVSHPWHFTRGITLAKPRMPLEIEVPIQMILS